MKDKIIKQNIILVSALIILVLICGGVSIIIENSGVVYTEAEMVQMIQKDQEIRGELTVIDTFYAENESNDNKLLLLCMAEDSYRDYFIAAQFEVVGENEYKFDKYEKLTEGKTNIFFGHWDTNYIVVCNEPDAVRYECEADGVLQDGNITTLPKVLMVEFEETCRIDIFDANGNQLY